jgi:hypothetical protein
MFASEACLELISAEHVAPSVDVIRTDMFDQTAGGKSLWELTGVEGKDTSRDATETVDGAGRSEAWLQVGATWAKPQRKGRTEKHRTNTIWHVLAPLAHRRVVTTEVGNDPKVAGLVYISAFAPDNRRVRRHTHDRRADVPDAAAPRPLLFLVKKSFPASFGADLDAEKAAFRADSPPLLRS